MGVWTKWFGGAEKCREIVRDTYARYVEVAKKNHRQSPYSPHIIGLYGALGTRYGARRLHVQVIDILSELAPFLVMGEQKAVSALAEYVVFKETPGEARTMWLGYLINAALAGVSDDTYRRMATMGMMNHVGWCALLTAETREMIEIWIESFKQEDETAEFF